MLPKRINSSELTPVLGEREVHVLLDKEILPETPVAMAKYRYMPLIAGPSHHHDIETEVYYCLNGSGTVTIDENTYSITPGVMLLIPPGKEHQTQSGELGLEFLAYFTPPINF